MKRKNLLLTLILTSMLAVIAGCASSPNKEGTGEYIDDTVITTKVKVAIMEDPALKSSEINVETFKGVVQLSGFVVSQDAINKAVETARGIKGVTSVINDMQLK
ncbi:BON domain-containing protein [Desulfofustis limnaeus]|jgi:osmotically-inducible protein OsmY|uniref:Transporter n=1 Tax=Desulfofustis limnaeus TaxID=2740163 RepID=A0ABN6M4M4_9BACT|nr:BON domain-containing protein [Desulfofustis limnaeus]BDD87862.1 transporter [Desulfofustis limnaeus]